jgi:hypothetical protein
MLTGVVSVVGLNIVMIVAFIIYDTLMDRTKK